MAFLYTDQADRGKTYADIQLIFLSTIAVPNIRNLRDQVAKEYLSTSLDDNGFTSAIILTHPKSRGSIRLRSSDPFEPPIIELNDLTNRRDIDKLISGLRIWVNHANIFMQKIPPSLHLKYSKKKKKCEESGVVLKSIQ